jgi:rhodanese-related sulfurtransferase
MMLFLAGTAGAVLLLASSRSQAQSAVVTLEQARADAEAGRALLVDIREPDEHATGVAAGARLLPMSQLSRRLTELPKDRPVLLICNTQNRSRATFDALRQQGYTNLQFVQGGMSEWARRRWPMVAPSKVAPPTPAAR